jgi:hypothetical protein
MCMAAVEEVDIMILVDVTGSHTALVRSNAEALANELAEALLLDADVRVGVSVFADFPVSPHGSPGDVPFRGLLVPTGMATMTESTIEMLPSMYGGDGPESGIEALSILAGGAVHPDAEPFDCPAGTEEGGCFRPGSWRAVVVLTDITQHNAPHPSLPAGTLVEPYSVVDPDPATWAEARTRMIASGLALFAIVPSSGGSGVSAWSPAPQLELLADELGQDPSTSVTTYTPGTMDLGPAIRTTADRLRDYFLLTLP